MKTPAITSRLVAPLAGLLAVALVSNLHAVDREWSGAAGNPNFGNVGNWQGGVAPVSSFTDDRGVFSITPGVGINQPFVNGNRLINGLVFNTSGWTFQSSTFTLSLGTGGIENNISSGTNSLVATPIGVGQTQTWKSNSGGRLEIGETTGSGTLNLGASDASGGGTVALTAASSRTGVTNFQGGIVEIGNNTALGTGLVRFAGASTLNSSSAISISNAVEFRSNLTTGGSGSLIFTGTVELGTNASRTLTVNNTTTTFGAITQDVGGPRALVIEGSGTAVFSGAASYSGTTTVSGRLLVNGSMNNSAVSVQNTGTLGGTGQIVQAVSVSGTLAPGTSTSIGTLSTGSLDINAPGTLSIQLGRDGINAVGDRVDVTGAVSLASGANLELSLAVDVSAPQFGDIFWLVSNDGIDAVSGVFTQLNGSFTDLSEGSAFSWNSQTWQITYQADFASSSFFGGNDIAIQVVPEPQVIGLLVIGLLVGLVVMRRSRAGRVQA